MRRFDLRKLTPIIADFARGNNISFVGLFGSEARNEAQSDSDVDLVVTFKKPVGLFAFVGMQEQLSSLLRKKVDLQTKKSIDHKIRPYIERDLITLYEEQ